MTLQPGKQTTAIHILTNMSRNKGNQTVKFGQLSMSNIFLEKSSTKCGDTHPQNYSQTLF